MEEILLELKKTLRARLTIVSDEESRRHPDQHMERLQQVSEELERLEQQLPTAIDPQLRHYLQRRSYSKALECLDAIHGEQVFNPVGGGS